MLQHLVVLILIFDYAIKAKMNHFIRADTSAPEIEIDQREYNNQDTLKKNPENTAVKEKFSDDEIEFFRLMNREKKDSPPKETIEDNTMPFHMKIFDADEDLSKLEDVLKDPDVISVSSYNIPKMPKKLYGPKNKPFKQLPFTGIGPAGIDEVDKPSCNAFSRTARFNPYSVLGEKWFSFYRWATDNTPLVIEFTAPTSWEIESIREHMDKAVETPISWSSRNVIMTDLIYNASGLLVERGDHGQFWLYPIMNKYTRQLEPLDVRFKQTADNKFFAFVICADDRAFIFARVKDVPLKKDIPDAVAMVGWRGRDGRSYLYQGHKWGPIPEMTEEEYWRPANLQKDEEEWLPPPPPEDDPKEEPIRFLNDKYKYNFK